MSTRRFSGRPSHRNRAAERRGVMVMAYARAIAEAEMHRDRAKARAAEILSLIEQDRAAGLDVTALEDRFAGLLASLAEREAEIVRARLAGGLDAGHAKAIGDHLDAIGLDHITTRTTRVYH